MTTLAANSGGGLAFYRDEIARRDSDRQARTMITLTWAVAVMTLAVVGLTVALLVKG